MQLSGAWRFRQEFQSRLGLVFDHLASIYHSFPGRITAETFKKQITSVVDIWDDWIVFPPEFTSELRLRLEGSVAPALEKQEETVALAPVEAPKPAFKFKISSFKPAEEVSVPPIDAASDGEPMDEGSDSEVEAAIPRAKSEDDLDGAPIGDDVDDTPVDGIPMDDIDGAPLDDVDGLPLDDVDGDPLGDDIDGEPMQGDVDGSLVDK